MKRALMIASVASMIDQFNMDNLKILINLGYKVDVACNFKYGSSTSQERVMKLKKKLNDIGVNTYHVSVPRSPFSFKELFYSYKRINELLRKNQYSIVHCHSPIGGAITRLAAKKYRKKSGLKVIYTAHGFHFYSSAPAINWLLYYPVERFLARYTDILITINREDYNRAKKFKTEVKYIPGVGVDTNNFQTISVNRLSKMEELGIPKDAYVILSVGEVNKNKNHEVIIRSLANINNSNMHYIICGKGALDNFLKNLAKSLGILSQVHLLGYREDVHEIYKIADLFAFPSYREGLGLSAIEAMASGLPLVTSNVHGIKDYSINGETSLSCKPDDVDCFTKAIKKFSSDKQFSEMISNRNLVLSKKFDSNLVNNKMKEIYSKQ